MLYLFWFEISDNSIWRKEFRPAVRKKNEKNHLVLQTLHHVDIDTVMITLSFNFLLYYCSSMKPKVPVNNMKETEQMWCSTGSCKRGQSLEMFGTILRTFHKTAMLFQTSWSFSLREITKSFKRKILETEFCNPVEYRKAPAQKWHGYCGSVLVLLVISASGNCSSPFLCVASFSSSVACANLSLY